jgi:hypothetical protein
MTKSGLVQLKEKPTEMAGFADESPCVEIKLKWHDSSLSFADDTGLNE